MYNQLLNKPTLQEADCQEKQPLNLNIIYSQPQCFAPDVNITCVKYGFTRAALSKLRKELQSHDPLLVRQVITNIADLIIRPQELLYAIELKIPERLAKFLVSGDSYLRERVGMMYTSIAAQSIGQELISKNTEIIYNLAQGLRDRLIAVRVRIAQTIEMLARSWTAAEDLCTFGFVNLIAEIIIYEKREILIIHLETLQSLLNLDIKKQAIEIGVLEKLVLLLKSRKDERILTGALACLAMLCREQWGKEKAIEIDLLSTLKYMLNDERSNVHIKAVNVMAFITTTTPGKLQAVQSQIMSRILLLATDCHSRELQLMALKTLTNIAEAPEGRTQLLEGHWQFIKGINICNSEDILKHKQILIDTIQWEPKHYVCLKRR